MLTPDEVDYTEQYAQLAPQDEQDRRVIQLCAEWRVITKLITDVYPIDHAEYCRGDKFCECSANEINKRISILLGDTKEVQQDWGVSDE